MAPTEAFASSATITTTARSMPSDTTTGVPVSRTDDGFYQLALDIDALALGDEFLVQMYEKARSADTQRRFARWPIVGPHTSDVLIFPAFCLMHGWDMSIVKIAGTDRAIHWSIRSLGTPAEYATFTETVSTTEWSILTDTAGPDADTGDKAAQVFLDVSTLATGDLFQFKGYEKARSGDTQRLAWSRYLSMAQSDPMLVVPTVGFMHGWDITVDKLAGTDRLITGSVRSVG